MNHKASTYDEGDRLGNTGVQYDTYGRTLAVPAADAGGSDFSATYYVNDLAHSMTQTGRTTTFGLDPLLRTRLRSTTGSADEVQHYGGDAPAPSWSEVPTSGAWTRLVGGISGLLGAIQQGNSAGPTVRSTSSPTSKGRSSARWT